jgi:acyl-CoA reductase-like NAD-dependent aldehyde dehydrogenase
LTRRRTEPKHLRTGINAAMSDQGGLATLLIAKGVFTRAEYAEAIADAMEKEAAEYEKLVSERVGKKVTLA